MSGRPRRWRPGLTLRRSVHDREIVEIALPALGALAADPIVSLVDTAFVGRLGVEPLASLGVAVAVFGIAFALANFLPYGATPLIAAAAGAGERDRAGRLGRGAFVLGIGFGLAAAAVLEVGASPLARLMGAAPDIVGGTTSYVRIRALSLPAVLVVLAAHGIFRGHQDTRTPFAVSIGISLVNLVLDPILIFGFDLGLAGAAWATAAAQWGGAAAFILLIAGRDRTRLALDAGVGVSFRPLYDAGVALIVRTAALVGSFSAATAVAARVGTVAVAAHQVAFQVWFFLALVVDALAIAGQARVGVHIGSGDLERARSVADRLLGMGLLLGAGIAVMLAATAGMLPGWFTGDREVIASIGTIYPFVVLTQPLNAIVFVWDGVGIGAGAFRYLAASMVVAATVCVAGLAFVLPLDLGLVGVWWSVVGLMVVRWLALAWWYATGPLGRRRGPGSPAA